MHELGRRPHGSAMPYTVPVIPREQAFPVPVTLFTNGWVHVLEDSELAFILMMTANDQATGGQQFMITAADRLHRFGMKHDGYEAHEMLSRLGLVDVTPDGRRRSDGQLRNLTQRGNRFPTCSDSPRTASAATPSSRSAQRSTVDSALPPSSPTGRRQRARTRRHTPDGHTPAAPSATSRTCSQRKAPVHDMLHRLDGRETRRLHPLHPRQHQHQRTGHRAGQHRLGSRDPGTSRWRTPSSAWCAECSGWRPASPKHPSASATPSPPSTA